MNIYFKNLKESISIILLGKPEASHYLSPTVANQDYTLQLIIIVIENVDELIFINAGIFLKALLMIISFIKKFGAASWQDIDKLVLDKLSDALDEEQKIRR